MARLTGPRRPPYALLAVALLGLALRLPGLPTPGTSDMGVWKAWAYATTQLGISGIYTLRQKPPPSLTPATIRQALAGDLPVAKVGYAGRAVFVDYPPGVLYVLGAVGSVYRATVSPAFVDRPALNAAIKLPLVLAEALTAGLLWAVVRRRRARVASVVAAAYWLNPTVILAGSVLGYFDALYGLLLVAGGLALLRGRPAGLWAGWALALSLKIQPLLLLPALLALAARRGPARLIGYTALAGAILLALALPYLLTGHTLALLSGLVVNAHEDYLSAYGLNIWWLWSYVWQATHGGGWGVQTAILTVSQLARKGAGPLDTWALVAFVVFTAFLMLTWLWSTLRLGASAGHGQGTQPPPTGDGRGTQPPPTGRAGPEAILLLALQLYGATMLLTSIHENHLLGVLPLLALAATWATAAAAPTQRLLWALYAALSLIAAAPLLLFYGLGDGLPRPLPQMWFGVDGSVIVALANVVLFAACCVAWARWSVKRKT